MLQGLLELDVINKWYDFRLFSYSVNIIEFLEILQVNFLQISSFSPNQADMGYT